MEHSFYVAGKGDSFLAKTAEDSSQIVGQVGTLQEMLV